MLRIRGIIIAHAASVPYINTDGMFQMYVYRTEFRSLTDMKDVVYKTRFWIAQEDDTELSQRFA